MKIRTAIKNRFVGKVALVTGGADGIGKSTIDELLREGAAVGFTDISDAGDLRKEEWQKKNYDILFCKGDMVDPNYCKEAVEQCEKKWGKINYLVNNAFSFLAKGLDASEEDWHRSLFTGPVAYARMVQHVCEPMKRAGGGAIVNISSISGSIAQINRWTYNAAKGAVNQLTNCQALDLAKYNIRVNTVSPGWIWTRELDKAAEIGGGGREKWDPIWGEYHMLRRCGEPLEVAGPILFLLSDDASFITGTELMVDGGYLSMGPEGLGQTTIVAGSR